jgi:hypothetical protein
VCIPYRGEGTFGRDTITKKAGSEIISRNSTKLYTQQIKANKS